MGYQIVGCKNHRKFDDPIFTIAELKRSRTLFCWLESWRLTRPPFELCISAVVLNYASVKCIDILNYFIFPRIQTLFSFTLLFFIQLRITYNISCLYLICFIFNWYYVHAKTTPNVNWIANQRTWICLRCSRNEWLMEHLALNRCTFSENWKTVTRTGSQFALTDSARYYYN